MADAPNIYASQQARDQVILPLSMAHRICMRGIRTRLGRSVVTLLGVSLGTAFLMSVLAGFLIRGALAEDAQRAREADRRVAVVRGQIGRLDGKSFLLLPGSTESVARGTAAAFTRHGATVHVGAVGSADEAAGVDAILVLEGGESLLNEALVTAAPVLTYNRLSPELATRLTGAGGTIRHVGIELRPEEIARQEARATEARYRIYWIVGVSLLITVIGIANAMLMSVTERVREIGTMKCLGALSGFVVKLFLIESSLLGLVGAASGCLAGLLFSILIYATSFGFGRVLSTMNYAGMAIMALASILTGVILAIIAAIYPARVAAGMIPASALRSNV